MGVRAMQTAATGMEAFMFNLDVIANNLANSGTTGFKRSRTNFEDLFYEYLKLPGLQDQTGKLTPVGIEVGLGVRVSSTEADHSEGSFLETGKQLDLAIAGDGFFQIQDGTQILYSRAGTFTMNADGAMVMASADRGRLLEPAITIPQGTTDISISADGTVSVLVPPTTTLTQLGQIQTVKFINPQGLIRVGENLFAQSDASGPANLGIPGLDGRGSLRQGFIEASNVEPVRELVNLIKTQRYFELSSQAIQASDQVLQLIANLRRF